MRNSLPTVPKQEDGRVDYKLISKSEQSVQTNVSQYIFESMNTLRPYVEKAMEIANNESIKLDTTPVIQLIQAEHSKTVGSN